MKKILLMCCFLVGMAAICRAQGRQQMSPADRAKQMQTSLRLTDDQTAKITAILQKQTTRMDSLRTAANGDRDAMRAAMSPIRNSATAQIKAVLTTEQAAAYQKQMDDQRARMQQGGAGSSGGGK